MTFVENIKKLLADRSLSQADLTRALGLKSGVVSIYVSGKSIPGVEVGKKIADYFSVSLDDLYYGDALNGNSYLYLQSINEKELELAQRFDAAFKEHEIEADPLKFYNIIKSYMNKLQQNPELNMDDIIKDTIEIFKIAS